MATTKRLIVCVDSFFSEPQEVFDGNPSNIFRIYCSLKKSKHNKGSSYEACYFDGVQSGSNPGQNVETQLHAVYKRCSSFSFHSNGKGEIWFFGFGYGAYVVRVVAAILTEIGALTYTNDEEFHQDFELMNRRFHRHESFKTSENPKVVTVRAKVVPAAQIKFLGILDTVVPARPKYDFSIGAGIEHVRHGLAINELNKACYAEPIVLDPSDYIWRGRSLKQAWFTGCHHDLGGGNEEDGLSLYPLQWLILEAKALGLQFAFEKQQGDLAPMQDPLELIKYAEDAQHGSLHFKAANGIATEMRNMFKFHTYCRYAIKLNQKAFHRRAKKKRSPIGTNSELRGYCKDHHIGTIIHPSFYLLQQNYVHVQDSDWDGLRADSMQTMMGMLDRHLWRKDTKDISTLPASVIRILVCGNSGAGKSSLINCVFGDVQAQASDLTRGEHDVRVAYRSPKHPNLILHDSMGFEAGSEAELNVVTDFVDAKMKEKTYSSRLHAIWYCIDMLNPRPVQGAEKKLWARLSASTRVADDIPAVPIIIVFTKKDKCRTMVLAEHWEEWRLLDNDELAKRKSNGVLDKEEKLLDILDGVQGRRDGICFLSNHIDDADDIKDLLKITAQNLDNEQVLERFKASQTYSIDQKIQDAIDMIIRLYKHATRLALPGSILPGANTAVRRFAGNFMISKLFNHFTFTRLQADVIRKLKDSVWPDIRSLMFALPSEVWSIAHFVTLGGYTYWIAKDHVKTVAIYNLTIGVDLILIFSEAISIAATSGRGAQVRSNKSVGSEFDDVDKGILEEAIDKYKKHHRDHVHGSIEKFVKSGSGMRAPLNVEHMRIAIAALIEDKQSTNDQKIREARIKKRQVTLAPSPRSAESNAVEVKKPHGNKNKITKPHSGKHASAPASASTSAATPAKPGIKTRVKKLLPSRKSGKASTSSTTNDTIDLSTTLSATLTLDPDGDATQSVAGSSGTATPQGEDLRTSIEDDESQTYYGFGDDEVDPLAGEPRASLYTENSQQEDVVSLVDGEDDANDDDVEDGYQADDHDEDNSR